MKFNIIKNSAVCLIFLLLFPIPFKAQDLKLWNKENLNLLLAGDSVKAIKSHFVKDANAIVKLPYVTVTDKKKSISGDIHNYESIGPYWWPNPQDPNGPYIRKDGIINPEYYDYDNVRLETLSKRLKCLAITYYVSKEDVYYDCYVKQLKAWFVDKETRMNPNMDYAQMIVGITNGKGRAAGLIEAYFFNDILESIRLIMYVKGIDKPIYKGVKDWFKQFSKWLVESDIGKKDRQANENHGIAYDVTLYNICLFIGNKKTCKEITSGFDKRLEDQIMPDGRMPRELVRTRAFHYSVMNLKQIIDFCILHETQGINYYKKHNEVINRACTYLLQYVNKKYAWPYEESGNWEYVENNLLVEANRLKRLSKRDNDFVTVISFPLSMNNILK